MGTIELPSLPRSTHLTEAFASMRKNQASGLVVRMPSGPNVFFAEELFPILHARGDLPLGELVPIHRSIRAPFGLTLAEATLVSPASAGTHAEMKARGAHFVVFEDLGDKAGVLTVSEALSGRLSI